MLKRLFALLAILGVAIAVVVGRKRSQTLLLWPQLES